MTTMHDPELTEIGEIAVNIACRKDPEWKDIRTIAREHSRLYKSLTQYGTSVCNPHNSSPEIAAACAECLKIIPAAVRSDVSAVNEYLGYIQNLTSSPIDSEKALTLLLGFKKGRIRKDTGKDFYSEYVSGYYTRLIENDTLHDPGILYRYGIPVSGNDIKLFRFLSGYGKRQLVETARHITEAFLHGFISQNKARENRNVVYIEYHIGQEPLILELLSELRKKNLAAHIRNVYTNEYNNQFRLDHQHDNYLYIDEEYTSKYEQSLTDAVFIGRDYLEKICGNIIIGQFGHVAKTGEAFSHRLQQNSRLPDLVSYMESVQKRIFSQYLRPEHMSKCKVAFPGTAAGSEFPEIFSGFLDINNEDSEAVEGIQKTLIDTLDLAESVHITGAVERGNQTDIRICLPAITHPDSETNFLNGGGDINIPYGEVFTTPMLHRTGGWLHCSSIFLKGVIFRNLKIHFTDGIADNWSCDNFPSPDDGRRLVEKMLLYPHKTLPIGEFALGTNTRAYQFMRKYHLQHILPPLVMEKTGPHFALGDPCFARIEDSPVFNILGGKEITAKENEKTRLRMQSAEAAYTNIHIDVTIPYDEIGSICVHTLDNRQIPIFEQGKYVLPGTESLNTFLGDEP